MRVLVFDTETTGLPEGRNPSITHSDKWPHIVQLSYLMYDTEKVQILTCHDHVVAIPEDVAISEESQNIHGITKSMCRRKGVPIEYALDDFNDCLQQCDRVVGHNLSFDKRMIMVESIRLKRRQYFTRDGRGKMEYCTMKNSTNICAIETVSATGDIYYKYPTLEELHHILFNSRPKGMHDSMADVLICLRCYGQVVHDHDITKEGCRRIKQLYKLYCV
jgi:DNA polymerase III epsilon subunit-like protein